MIEKLPSRGVPTIVACTDGPLLVRGDFEIVDSSGTGSGTGTGTVDNSGNNSGEPAQRGRRTVALCRCGVSTIKPYCDGTHKLINFRTNPVLPE
jgi:CDGSH-type Zn-finger protein